MAALGLLVVWVMTIWTWTTLCVCAVLVWRSLRAPPASVSHALPDEMLVVRPCAGLELNLKETLLSAVVLRQAAPRLLVHVVAAGDAAQGTAEAATVCLRQMGLAAHMQLSAVDCVNHKAGQLALFDADASRYSVCICVDSDVQLEPETLKLLCAPFADPKCGASWLPFVQTGAPKTFGDRINGAILAASMQSFGLLRHLDSSHLVGKVVAIRSLALRDAGGWGSVQHLLGEDTALGQRVTAAGWAIRCAQGRALTPATGRSLKVVFARYMRWAMVMRRHRPRVFWCYPLLVCPLPFQALAWAGVACFAGWPRAACAGFAVNMAVRMVTMMLGLRQAAQSSRLGRDIVDAIAADVLLDAAFIAAAARKSLTWRGRRLTFGRAADDITSST